MANKKSKLKLGLIILSCALSVVGLFSGIASLRKLQTTKVDNVFDYEIGKIDEAGDYVNSKLSIVSKDFNNVEGMSIEVLEKGNVTYKIVFYDEDKKFVSDTEALDFDVDEKTTVDEVKIVPETAAYFKLEITPNLIDGENVKVNVFNMNKYVSMLKVIYNK